MNYQVGDFVIRIKNAALANRKSVVLPYSKVNKEVGAALVREHFLENVAEEVQENKKVLVAKIKYSKRKPVLTDVSIVSKPSLRVYAKSTTMNKFVRGREQTLILSTSQGVLTGQEAKKKGIGGELLFRIW